MADCYYSGNCTGCAFDGKCLVQLKLIKRERMVKEIGSLVITLAVGCEVMKELEREAEP